MPDDRSATTGDRQPQGVPSGDQRSDDGVPLLSVVLAGTATTGLLGLLAVRGRRRHPAGPDGEPEPSSDTLPADATTGEHEPSPGSLGGIPAEEVNAEPVPSSPVVGVPPEETTREA